MLVAGITQSNASRNRNLRDHSPQVIQEASIEEPADAGSFFDQTKVETYFCLVWSGRNHRRSRMISGGTQTRWGFEFAS
jgi:hypothetical protein